MIHLFRVNGTGTIAFDTGANTNGYFKVGSGINSLGHGRVIRGSHMQVHRSTHLTWRYGLMATINGQPVQTDVYCNRARFSDGGKVHLSRNEWKFGGPLESIRSAWILNQRDDGSDNIYCKDCTIADYHEWLVSGGSQYRFRNCVFWHIHDDGAQGGTDRFSRLELGYCAFIGSAVWGLGQPTQTDDPNPGESWLHHCIIDVREERNTDERSQPHPHFPYLQHSPAGIKPFKIYNNLLFWGPDLEEEQGHLFTHGGATGKAGTTTRQGQREPTRYSITSSSGKSGMANAMMQ